MFGNWSIECNPYDDVSLIRVVTGGRRRLLRAEARALDILCSRTAIRNIKWELFYATLERDERFIILAYNVVLTKVNSLYYSEPDNYKTEGMIDSAVDHDLFMCSPVWFDITYDGYQFFVFGNADDFFHKTARVLAIDPRSLIPSEDGTYFIPKTGAICLKDLKRYEGMLNKLLKQFDKECRKEMKEREKSRPREITQELQDELKEMANRSESN